MEKTKTTRSTAMLSVQESQLPEIKRIISQSSLEKQSQRVGSESKMLPFNAVKNIYLPSDALIEKKNPYRGTVSSKVDSGSFTYGQSYQPSFSMPKKHRASQYHSKKRDRSNDSLQS